MFRTSFCAVTVLMLLAAGLARADEPNHARQAKHYTRATITNVNPQQGTITVRLRGENGRSVQRTFKLVEDSLYLDSSGNVAELDVFRSGDRVLYVEREGKIRAMKKQRTSGIL
jgi:hypothetical protein